jgi:ribonuclease-3
VIGAIYLQYGFGKVRKFILDMLVPEIKELDEGNYGDFKTMLQERAQKEDYDVNYRILDEVGPDHDKLFTAGVYVHGDLKGKGSGKTKKEAEQNAARLALMKWEG